MVRFIELFCGIGGFRVGLEKTNKKGWEHISKSTRSRGCSRFDRDKRNVKIYGIEGEFKGASSEDYRGVQQANQTYRKTSLPENHLQPHRCNFSNGKGGSQRHYQNFRCVWSNDNNKYACQIYRRHFGSRELIEKDIRTIDVNTIPEFDLLTAGFPCQSFSVAGKRKGFKDIRGTLFYEICRVAKAKRPPLLLLENVKGLLNHDEGLTFQIILESLAKLGYWCEWEVFNSKYYGVPQNRERVFIIGHLGERGGREVFPIGECNELPSESGNTQVGACLDANYYKGARRQRQFVMQQLMKVGNIAKSGHDSLWGRVYSPSGLASSLNSEGGGVGAKTGIYAVLTPTRQNKRQHGRRFKDDEEEMFTLTEQDVHGVAVLSHSPLMH